ncbi:MAG: hypothetical protein D6714_00220, partial [Bacteroidetes bacterium]
MKYCVRKFLCQWILALSFAISVGCLWGQSSETSTPDQWLNAARNQVQYNLDSVIFYMDKAIEAARQTDAPDQMATLFREKGYYFEIFGHLDRALKTYRQGLDYAYRSDQSPLILALLTDLAITERKSGQYKSALDYHTRALELAEAEKDLANQEYSLHGIGYLYETTGDYEKALQYYLRSLEIAEQRGEKSGVVTTLQNIAQTYSKIGNPTLAQQNIARAFDLARELKDTILLTNVLFDYGSILQNAQDFEGALDKFKQSLDINKRLMSKETVARSLMYLADVYNQIGQFESAEQYLTQCLDYKDFMRPEFLAELYHKLGNLYLTKKAYGPAKSAFLNSLKIAEADQFAQLKQQDNYALYQIYSTEGQLAEALYHLERATALRDSLFNAEQNARMAELQFRYDAEKSEKQIHQLQSRQNRMMWIGSMILSGIIILSMGVFIRISRQNNHKLRLKNAEIRHQNIKLKESNEVLQQFAYVAAHDLKEPLRSIGSFIGLLQRRYGAQFNMEANEYMDFVRQGVNRMNDLINALLQYSTISIQKPTDEVIDVREVVERVSENLREPIESKKGEIRVSADLPHIQMNPVHVTQLFQNLISNGLKFSRGIPVVQISGEELDDEIRFCVEDNGIGIEQ